MERLTFEGNFCDIAQCRELPCPHGNSCSQRKAWERLKEYEDTGLTPEQCAEFSKADKDGRYIIMRDAEQAGVARMRELGKADSEGRVVVLPCKVGDTVWLADSIRGVCSARVRTLFCGHPSSERGLDSDGGIQMIRTTECDIPFRKFGKMVFLTREEAEKALEEKKNGQM